MTIDILHRDDLPLGGFAGIKEHRLVMAPEIFGQGSNSGAWPGIGGFVYLADARFNPQGETRMHSHKEVDVISVMVEGRIDHQGSLEHGQRLEADNVQVQRAGGEGFSHNEINPDDTFNRMIQLWVLPEQVGERAAYKLYTIVQGKVMRVYGGSTEQSDTLPSHTAIDVVSLNPSQEFILEKPFLIYLVVGKGSENNLEFNEGDLIKGEKILFKAESDVKLIAIYVD